ncbi:MAG TPA: DUF3108 domain-containing protein [Patescibacteria group bacterium]|nr:DUF3108 domain-containing protein [Patescibacteria group bacterium]
MRKTLIFLGIFVLCAGISSGSAAEKPVVRTGERIVYTVRLKGVNVGTAIFTQKGKTVLGKEAVNLVTFETRVTGFQDTEKIYSDPHSYLPVRIERDINGMSGREKITEAYDQKKHVLVITKVVGKTTREQLIKKETPIHNAIMLPFYVRDIANLAPGWGMQAQLPTQFFIIKLGGIEDVKVPAGKFKCYRFESEPKRFEIWITADGTRIPVKIKGAAGLGYSLLMREYSHTH